jgi:hypothetical protein
VPSVDNSPAQENAPPPVAQNSAPPGDVGDIQQYQAQNQYSDPYAMQGQSSFGTGSSLLIPLIGGLIAYGALSSFGSSYSSPPNYYYPPQPPIYYNPQPYPRRHRHFHGNPFPSSFTTPPPARPFSPPPVLAAPSHPVYAPPPVRFSSSPPVTQHSYSGGYHSGFGGAPASGGGFHGGHH